MPNQLSKRLIPLLSFLLLLLPIAAVVGAGKSEGGAGSPAALSKAELVYYTCGTGQPPEMNLVEEAMNKILLARINATIKVNFIPYADYTTKMNVLVASGDPFDICFSASWMQYGIMASRGAYADLTDLLPKYCADYLKQVPAFVVDAAKIGGKAYAAPNLQALAIVVRLQVIGELADKYQLPASIKSLDELGPYLDAMVQGEPGLAPIYSYTNPGLFAPYDYYMRAYSRMFDMGVNVGWYGTDFKVVNQFDTATAKAWYAWARKAYQRGWLPKNAATGKDDANIVKAKKAAVIFTGSSPQLDANQNVTLYLPLSMKWIDLGAVPYVRTGNCTGTMLSINENSKNKARAAMYINLINTDKKLYNTLCYGVEGKHYILAADGIHFERPAGVTEESIGYNPSENWAFGFTYNAYLPKGVDPGVGEQQLAYDRKASLDPALGFAFDQNPVEAEIANVQTVLEEIAPSLEAGALEPDAGLAKLLDALKKAGVDKIIAEEQRQLDAWRAANGK